MFLMLWMKAFDFKITIQYQSWKKQLYTFISTPQNLFLAQVLANQLKC